MKLNELVDLVHGMAKDKGWWNPAKSPLECHMMMVTELAEATESCRVDEPPFFFMGDDLKPEGEAVELADVVIRIADYFGYRGWNLEDVVKAKISYNTGRSHRHGNKKF